MGKVIYLMNVTLDGFVETPDHSLDWGKVDDELHAFFNQQSREAGAFVYGRKVYEVMAAYWPTGESNPASTPVMVEFARIWNPKPKVVFSTTLTSVDWNSRLARGDVGEELERIRAEIDGDLEVAGPNLAAQFIRRGLVDEYRMVVHPVLIGAGTPYFPPLDRQIDLELVESQRFASGVVYHRYLAAR